MIFDPDISIPSDIIQSARKVEEWMKSQGHTRWKLMGIQSRDLESEPGSGGGTVRGDLIHLKYDERMPTIELLSKDVERNAAKITASMEMDSLGWPCPRQVLFVRRDGFMEIWEK